MREHVVHSISAERLLRIVKKQEWPMKNQTIQLGSVGKGTLPPSPTKPSGAFWLVELNN